MLEGSIKKGILLFALPIFLGQLLQQLYSIVDSIIVGNCVGTDALAAVNSTGSLTFLFVGFVNGLFVGMGVIVGMRFGAKDYKALSIATHTGVAFGVVSGLILTLVGVLLSPTILVWMGTPDEVMPQAVLYLRIFFAGGVFLVVYNTCCGIFQAVGDSKHPLYYLIASALINTGLDLLFVVVFKWGIAGAAWATVIAEAISATLAFGKLLRVDGPHKLMWQQIKIDWHTLRDELRLGLPNGIQNSVISIANVVVQSNINAFGSLAMAGCGSYFKLEGFAFLPIMSCSMAMTTFVSQNLGARQIERAKAGSRFGMITGVASAELIGITLYIVVPWAISLFDPTPAVIAFGTKQARIETLFYCMLAFNHCISGVLRGAGKTSVPMAVMLAIWCVFRIAYITIAVKIWPVITTIFIAYPLTWTLSAIIFTIYYYKVKIFKAPDQILNQGN